MSATLRSRLPQIAAGLRGPRIDLALKAGAERVSEGAKARVHVLSGDLRDATHVEDAGTLQYAVVAGNEQVFYGHLEEHGSAHSPPHPFLIPSLEAERDAVVAGVAAALRFL